MRKKTATSPRQTYDDLTISRALSILQTRLKQHPAFTHPESVKNFLRLQAQSLPNEIFAVMHLDAQNRLIDYERLFHGTLTRTNVYPREVVKRAIAMNAAAVILHHNHPSGACNPSAEDIAITRCLRAALALVEIDVLDHVVTSDAGACSMAERGLLA
ncbi:MAG: DNA repair protein RadC [Ramlibacter sp.]|nr:DNA repair protein RadC [Ramlibacter sp.]